MAHDPSLIGLAVAGIAAKKALAVDGRPCGDCLVPREAERNQWMRWSIPLFIGGSLAAAAWYTGMTVDSKVAPVLMEVKLLRQELSSFQQQSQEWNARQDAAILKIGTDLSEHKLNGRK